MTTTQPRDVRLGRLFVQLADSLVSDFETSADKLQLTLLSQHRFQVIHQGVHDVGGRRRAEAAEIQQLTAQTEIAGLPRGHPQQYGGDRRGFDPFERFPAG